MRGADSAPQTTESQPEPVRIDEYGIELWLNGLRMMVMTITPSMAEAQRLNLASSKFDQHVDQEENEIWVLEVVSVDKGVTSTSMLIYRFIPYKVESNDQSAGSTSSKQSSSACGETEVHLL